MPQRFYALCQRQNNSRSARVNGHKTAAIVVSLLLIISGCSETKGTGAKPQAVIQVDNSILTLTQFNEFFEPIRMSYANGLHADDPRLCEARLRFLLQLVEEMIILRRAKELNLRVSAEELADTVSNIENDYTKEGLKAMFMKQAISLDTWKERVRRELLIKKVVDKELSEKISVAPKEIRDYYDKHKDEWTCENRTKVLHILLPNEKLANTVLDQLKKGGDFAQLARFYSTAPESKRGGDMGYVTRGELPECLEDPVFALKKNMLSPVIKTPYGYHIFKVVEKRQAGEVKIDELIEKIRKRLREEKLAQAYGSWLAKLRSRYKVMVNNEII